MNGQLISMNQLLNLKTGKSPNLTTRGTIPGSNSLTIFLNLTSGPGMQMTVHLQRFSMKKFTEMTQTGNRCFPWNLVDRQCLWEELTYQMPLWWMASAEYGWEICQMKFQSLQVLAVRSTFRIQVIKIYWHSKVRHPKMILKFCFWSIGIAQRPLPHRHRLCYVCFFKTFIYLRLKVLFTAYRTTMWLTHQGF